MSKFEKIMIIVIIAVLVTIITMLIVSPSNHLVEEVENGKSMSIKFTRGNNIIDLRINGSDDIRLLTSLVQNMNLGNVSIDTLLKKYLDMKGLVFNINYLYRVNTNVNIDGKELIIFEYYVGGNY